MSPPESTSFAGSGSRRRRVKLALVTLFFAAGCGKSVTVPDFRGRPAAREIIVNVQNHHFADVVVYIARGGSWQRLGDVTGSNTSTMVIPSSMTSSAAQYRIRVHPIGGQDRDDYITGTIPADLGDIIEVRVAGSLRMSNWWIR